MVRIFGGLVKLKFAFRNSIKHFVLGLREPQNIVVIGAPGSGKSSLVTALNVLDYKYNYKYRKEISNIKTKQMQDLGFYNVDYTNALYHSNLDMILNLKKGISNNFTDFTHFGLPTENNENLHNYSFGSLLSFEEPELDIDSREYKNFDSVSKYGALKIKRHKKLTLLSMVHDPSTVEKRVRQDYSCVIYLYGKPILKKWFFGLFYTTTWYARLYYSAYGKSMIDYGFLGDVPKEKHLNKYVKWVKFKTYRNIFNYYNDTALEPNWYINEPFSAVEHMHNLPNLNEIVEHRKMYGFGRQKTMFDNDLNNNKKEDFLNEI